jgi:hypothetical protein
MRAPKSLWLVKGTLAPSDAKDTTFLSDDLASSGCIISGKLGLKHCFSGSYDILIWMAKRLLSQDNL